jgi:hypothetical protein
MNIQGQASDQVAELVAALKSVSISEKHLAELRMLYETPKGFPYSIDKKNAPQAETIEACRRVGSSLKKALGITSAKPYGMNLIGYGDPDTSTWRMKPAFRAALDSLGLFGSSNLQDAQQTEPQSLGFEAWLVANGNSKKTASNYSGAIDGRLKTLATQLALPNFTASQIDSAASFGTFCNAHDASNEILDLNVRGKDMYRRALVWYAKYLAQNSAPASLQDLEERFRAKVRQSLKDTSAARAARLKKAGRVPRVITVTSVAYERNPDVVAQALLDAGGRCQECKAEAPFKRKADNTPYLEVHHRIPLSRGGEDSMANAVALCPNCHRKLHYGP